MKKLLLGVMVLFAFGCKNERHSNGGGPDNNNVNHNPRVENIQVQTVLEGMSFTLDLSPYVSDPDNDLISIEKISGPGSINGFVYAYQDIQDNDRRNNSYVIEFRVQDIKGGTATGSFQLVQNDTYSFYNPTIGYIKDQIVEEGKILTIDLRSYVFDLDGDPFIIEKLSGPGDIINNVFNYKDEKDSDLVNNQYKVEFRVQDARGGQASGAFAISQKDVYHRLSSGIYARIIDSCTAFYNQYGNIAAFETGIAVNLIGQPLIIYNPKNWGNLFYAYLQNEIWSGTYIDGPIFGGDNSVVYDNKNTAHLSLSGFGCGEKLVYSSFYDGKWSTVDVDINCSTGLENDIAVDSQGYIHISYWNWLGKILKYATNKRGAWEYTDIFPATWAPTSIALDEKDNVHIAYMHQGVIYKASNVTGSWTKQEVRKPPIPTDEKNVIHNPFLRKNHDGSLHIVFQDGISLYHTTFSDGAWNTETAIHYDNLYIKDGSRLVFAPNIDGALYIPHVISLKRSGEKGALSIATNKGGEWKTYLLDDSHDYVHPYIACDEDGNVHLSVNSLLNNDDAVVKYIVFDPLSLH